VSWMLINLLKARRCTDVVRSARMRPTVTLSYLRRRGSDQPSGAILTYWAAVHSHLIASWISSRVRSDLGIFGGRFVSRPRRGADRSWQQGRGSQIPPLCRENTRPN
jgi:hypothetical protein